MSIYAGQTLVSDFTVVSSTGALVNADSTPTGTLVVNGTDNAATVTVTNKATGIYKASVTVPTTSAIGDVCQIRIAATVSSVASGGYVFTGSVDVPSGHVAQTWFVATTGSDSNHGRSSASPKLTIAAAITAATSGDTIDIGAGTFTEQVATGTKVLTFIGRGWNKTTITRSTSASSTVLNPAPGSKFIGLKILHTGTDASGIDAEYADDIHVENCYLSGAIDGYTGHHSSGLRVVDSTLVGSWDGGGFEDCIGFYGRNITFRTTCEWSWNGSAYTNDVPMHALQFTGSTGTLINCKYEAIRQHVTTYYTAGIATGQATVIDGGWMYVLSTEAGSTGAVYGLRSQTGTVTELRAVKFEIESAGSGNVSQVSSSGNDIAFDNGTGITATGDTLGTLIQPASTVTGYTSALATSIGTTNTRVDAAVTTRLAAASYTAPPSSADQTTILNLLQSGGRS